jgi:hypothetical protein
VDGEGCDDDGGVEGQEGVVKTSDTHGEMTGVPNVGYFDRIGGKGSEGIGVGVGRGKWFVKNMFDEK